MNRKPTTQFPKLPIPLILAGSITGLLLVSIPFVDALADRREQPVQQTIATFSQQLSPQPANRSAVNLDARTEQLGISLSPMLIRQPHQKAQPTKPASPPSPQQTQQLSQQQSNQAMFGQVGSTLQEVLDYQLANPTHNLALSGLSSPQNLTKTPATHVPIGVSLPQHEAQSLKVHEPVGLPIDSQRIKELKSYLDNNRSLLNTLQQEVRQQETPHWVSNPAWATQQPKDFNVSPPFWPIANLQRLLLLEALEQQNMGNSQVALNYLEASWTINQSLRDRPEWDAQRTAMIVNSLQLGVIRQLGNVPPVWHDRLADHDYRQSVLIALQAKAIKDFHIDRDPFWTAQKPEGHDVQSQPYSHLQPMGLLSVPYARLMAATRFQTKQQWLQAVPSLPACSPKQLQQKFHQTASQALLMKMTEIEDSLQQATRQMMAIEATQQILPLQAMATQTGTLPTSLPAQPSAICPAASWHYQRSADGRTATLALQSAPTWLITETKPMAPKSSQAHQSDNLLSNLLMPYTIALTE